MTIKTTGDVVMIKASSYRRAQERQHVAQALLKAEEEHVQSLYRWVAENLNRERHLSDRCTYLYGLAASLGATPEQLNPADAAVYPPQEGT